MYLPSDPVILESYLNTLLRDQAESFDALCDYLDTDPDELALALQRHNLAYNGNLNRIEQEKNA